MTPHGRARRSRRAGSSRRKPLAGRLVPCEATLALSARHVVDESYATAVLELGGDLVPQHRARMRCVELLDVRPAEAAAQDAREGTRPLGLRHVGQDGLPAGIEDDRPHGAYRRSLRTEGGACRSSCTAAPHVGEDVRPPVLARPEGTRRHGRRVRGRQGGVATTEPPDSRDRRDGPELRSRRSSSRTGRGTASQSAEMERRPRGPLRAGYRRLTGAHFLSRGAIAQLGERLDRTQEVAGSSPASSTPGNAFSMRVSGVAVRHCESADLRLAS